MTKKQTIHLIGAARPNFMKIAPLYHELKRRSWCDPVLVHTGQHYDQGMSDVFFRDFGLPAPDLALGIGGGTHGEQLGKVVMAYEKALTDAPPALVTVVGDVNATAACTLAAKKLNLPVAHVEAGLRSRDRTMPEEINRLVTDSICDLHLTPSQDADENLLAEGVPASCIHFVGNIMIDSLVAMQPAIKAQPHPFPQLDGRRYGVATFHRPANVDDGAMLKVLVEGLTALAARLPLILPLHPRTRARLQAAGLLAGLEATAGMTLCEPLGYTDFMRCVFGAALVVTDSGGVQEETTYLGIPCFTARTSTERPITVTLGTNRLIAVADIAGLPVDAAHGAQAKPLPLWDGKTAVRVADLFEMYLSAGAPLRQG
ncbi:non-hydrolyzing UDP-N-acetylglucosamine 2-epimerase [Undibacter mobilis]|uniref:UDP-N-acetylglucosamine 2-epimerase (Non-hydrolyzing) n=1 Tax=Undibacter mobilis TaxID=2292256 RepID=A0A371B6I7_9BRAD|nr:UDP-N-acetylglucosamine 2-epimerase (non-hydrolyzing) [Undibacter mobilis]RDV03132.1 UDP-N-acetylglucosamine 2-epimerase (non-hydrolyzing) [Undibacter mobilis]